MRILKYLMYKDLLLLMKDKGGLILTFVLPVFLVFVMTFAQNNTFEETKAQSLPIVLVNMDSGTMGESICNSVREAGVFNVVKDYSHQVHGDSLALARLLEDDVKVAIIIHEHCSKSVKNKVLSQVKNLLPTSLHYDVEAIAVHSDKHISILFDPTLNPAIKQAIQGNLSSYMHQIETQLVFKSYTQILAAMTGQRVHPDSVTWDAAVDLHVAYAQGDDEMAILPNSVQHNIPSWMLFALFFVCIPMSGNILSEKFSGCRKRLSLLPIPSILVPVSKILVFTIYGFFQGLVMIAIGMYLMPLAELPALHLPHNLVPLFFFLFIVALTASCFGYFIGHVATSHQQSGVLGSISVMIMAALGGLWIPIFIMPRLMQLVSRFSPLNWALDGFYGLFVRGGGWHEILCPSLLLLTFAALMIFWVRFTGKKIC